MTRADPADKYFSDWVERRLNIALRLRAGELGGSYYDAALVLSALISALAAIAWPRTKDREDQKRFVEAWVRLSDPTLRSDRISVPLLVESLEREERAPSAERLRATHRALDHSRLTLVIDGDQVDLSSDEVQRVVPELTPEEIRRFSYGAVFYREVRSGLVHEYRLSKNAEGHAMAEKAPGPSYVNLLVDVDPDDLGSRRVIHFPAGWLAEIGRSVADRVGPLLQDTTPLARPDPWWLDGG